MGEAGGVVLAKDRLNRSHEALMSAQNAYDNGFLTTANNRAYYSMFHAMRAVLALDGEEYKTHSHVIGYFNRVYFGKGLIDRRYQFLIDEASRLRNVSDYQDYLDISVEDTKYILNAAKQFYSTIEMFLFERFQALS